MSLASTVLRGEATGWAEGFIADIASVGKRDLKPGDILDDTLAFRVRKTLEESSRKLMP